MAYERQCTVCGKIYEYCPRCSKYNHMEKWHIEYCSDQCRTTSSIINRYAFKHITKDEAMKLLKENNITKKSTLLPSRKEYIDEILKQEKRTVKKKKTIVNED